MAKVKIEEIIEHLDFDMKRALEAAVNETIPSAQFDRNRLYKSFVKHVRLKCSTWERVSGQHVKE